jgi:UDP-glucose 4-epimerase
MQKKYLVTGGDGFIGRAIFSMVSSKIFDIKSGKDILNIDSLKESIKNSAGIFHCAAKISVPESFEMKEEYYKNNVLGMKNVVDVASFNNTKIIFSSSAAVYGQKDRSVIESEKLSPESPYAQNKIDGENLLKNSKTPHIALRYFNVYGPRQSAAYAGVITIFIKNALSGEPLVIFGDGKQVRDFVFVDDVARANILAMQYNNKNFEIFNIGSGIETSIIEIADVILKLTNSNSKIIYKPMRAGDIIYSNSNTNKAKKN